VASVGEDVVCRTGKAVAELIEVIAWDDAITSGTDKHEGEIIHRPELFDSRAIAIWVGSGHEPAHWGYKIGAIGFGGYFLGSLLGEPVAITDTGPASGEASAESAWGVPPRRIPQRTEESHTCKPSEPREFIDHGSDKSKRANPFTHQYRYSYSNSRAERVSYQIEAFEMVIVGEGDDDPRELFQSILPRVLWRRAPPKPRKV
jgi:hypothetical protein